MSDKCLRCGKEFELSTVEDLAARKYPSCQECWKEWNSLTVMIINEMRLDMSVPEHRKALKKQEKMFFNKQISEDNLQKNPDKP